MATPFKRESTVQTEASENPSAFAKGINPCVLSPRAVPFLLQIATTFFPSILNIPSYVAREEMQRYKPPARRRAEAENRERHPAGISPSFVVVHLADAITYMCFLCHQP